MRPFKMLTCPAPNTHRLDVPAKWHVSPEFNDEQTSNVCARTPAAARVPGPGLQVVEDPPAQAVQELLK
jgi:hypothetical protein